MNDFAERFSVIVRATFCATHQIRLPDGQLEPLHGHDWQVRLIVSRPALDDIGLVADFHHVERKLRAVVRELDQKNLNDLPAFASVNPTAERVAQRIFNQLTDDGLEWLQAVFVTEAPGCTAVYERRPASNLGWSTPGTFDDERS